MIVESDNGRDLPPSGQSLLQKSWPYVGFLLFVATYSYFFLADGFNATDEGYLQSLAQRIIDGQRPYVDFHFLRPPGSLYIQAGLMSLLGDSYTIMVTRWIWTIEMVLLTAVLSIVYRRGVSSLNLFGLLAASWIVSSLLIQFMWYSYDAVFFAVVALVMIHKRWYLAAGLAIFLAGMCKQNYLLLLPGFILLGSLAQWRLKGGDRLNSFDMPKIVVGFLWPALGYLWYLSTYDAMGSFVESVFVLPPRISETGILFTVLQNNPIAFLKALPSIILAVCLLWFNHDSKSWLLVTAIAAVSAVAVSFIHFRWFTYNLIFFNYALLLIAIVRYIVCRQIKIVRCLWPVIVMALVIQYASGFNYAGVLFGYMAAAPGLCIGWLLVREADRSTGRHVASTVLILTIVAIGMFYKVDFMAGDTKRWLMDAEFTTNKLAGIRSTERNVNQIEGMLQAIDRYSDPGDYIAVFPDFPALYYLSGRRNPMKLDWFILREYNVAMLRESVVLCDSLRPKVVLLQTYGEIDWRRQGNPLPYISVRRWRPFVDWLFANYKMLEMVGDVAIFVPGERVDAPIP